MKVKSESEVAQSCLTLSDPMDCSLPGSSIHGIFQAKVLEWGAIAFSRWTLLLLLLLSRFSHVRLCATPQTAAHQAPLSLGFSRQEYWSGLSFPSPIHACMLSRFSHVQLFATPWTVAHQAPQSMGLSRQEYWSGLPWSPLGDPPDSGREPKSLMSPALAGGLLPLAPLGNAAGRFWLTSYL